MPTLDEIRKTFSIRIMPDVTVTNALTGESFTYCYYCNEPVWHCECHEEGKGDK